MSFLGRKLTGYFQDDLVTDRFDPPLRGRIPGCRVTHRMKQNRLEMYNKAGFVLRVKTVIHSPEEFRVRRRVHRGRRRVTAWVPLRKSVADLFRYREISLQSSSRYLNALADVDDPSILLQAPDRTTTRRLSSTTRPVKVFNPLARSETQLFAAVMRGARGAGLHQSGSTRRARPRGRAPGGRPQEMQRPSQSHAPSSARVRSRRQDPALSPLARHALGLSGHACGAARPTHEISSPRCRCRLTDSTLLCKPRRSEEERIQVRPPSRLRKMPATSLAERRTSLRPATVMKAPPPPAPIWTSRGYASCAAAGWVRTSPREAIAAMEERTGERSRPRLVERSRAFIPSPLALVPVPRLRRAGARATLSRGAGGIHPAPDSARLIVWLRRSDRRCAQRTVHALEDGPDRIARPSALLGRSWLAIL